MPTSPPAPTPAGPSRPLFSARDPSCTPSIPPSRPLSTPSGPPSRPPSRNSVRLTQYPSRASTRLARVLTSSTLALTDDGLDNFPPPLPGNLQQLQRRLTEDPDLERQMGLGSADVGPPPEGGRDAWGCVGSAFLVLFCVFGFVTSFGQLEVWYLEHQLKNYSSAQVAWISSVQTFLTFVGSIVAGRYFDSYGARPLVIPATSLSVGAVVAIAFSTKYWHLMLSHAAFGLSGSLLYSPATAVAGHWFMRRRSTAVGIVVCGSGLGGVIYPIMEGKLFPEIGFRKTMLIIAGMNAVLLLPSWFLLKGRLPPRVPPPLKSLAGPWRETRYAFLVIGTCAITLNWVSPYFNAPVLAASNNLSATLTSYSIAILQAGSFFGRMLSGVLADRFGVWNMFVFMALLQAVTIFAFWTASPIPAPAVVVGMVGYGFASGAWITLVAATVGAISPTREFGMRLGMLWSSTSIPLLIGPVICGVLVGADKNRFTYAAIFCGLSYVIGTAVVLFPTALDLVRRKKERANEKQVFGESCESMRSHIW